MSASSMLVPPRIAPPLDPEFRPAALAHRAFLAAVEDAGGGVPLCFALERGGGEVSRFDTRLLPEGHPYAAANAFFAERVLKFLLWQKGAWRVHVAGPRPVADHLASVYRSGGARAFDAEFLGERVYGRPFTVVPCAAEEIPAACESGMTIGRHLDGCRIGFDLGASDRKVSAVINGTAVFSEEVVWEPKTQSDPEYHYLGILAGIRAAAAHLPRVDAIGGSAAGIYIENRPRVASLFRGVPAGRYDEVHAIFERIQREFPVPLAVVNDGEVTALAGSMSLDVNNILGIALGSSEAGGFVTPGGQITGWLNELAFAPVDYAPGAPIEEWSRDRGVGARYFSQQCVFRLAPAAGIALPEGGTDAARLRHVQELLEKGDPRAEAIWRSMGVYLGYALAHYHAFYEMAHVLILGRCTSGSGGAILVEEARRVLHAEFPDLTGRLHLHLPDERSRRVGQAIAAASLPSLSRKEHAS